jgi:hypothetical protein
MARIIGTIKAIVAGLAEAAQLAQAEGSEVASVRLDVVSDRRLARRGHAQSKSSQSGWMCSW